MWKRKRKIHCWQDIVDIIDLYPGFRLHRNKKTDGYIYLQLRGGFTYTATGRRREQVVSLCYEHVYVFLSHNRDRVLNDCEDIDHIDANRSNNDISNLQVLTKKENNAKRLLQNEGMGRRVSETLRSRSKFKDCIDEIKDSIAKGVSQRKIAAKFGISKTMVAAIKHGKTWV